MSGARAYGLAGPIDSTGHCLRCGLMTDAAPSERPATVRGRRPLGWQSLPRFSFVCSSKILVSGLDLQDEAIVFSSFPPSDRSRGSKACPRDGKAAVAPNSAMDEDSILHLTSCARIFGETSIYLIAKEQQQCNLAVNSCELSQDLRSSPWKSGSTSPFQLA